MNRFVKVALCAAPLLLSACATNIKATATQNPPPAEAFSAFGRIEVKQAAFPDGVKGNVAALAKINANIQKDMAASLAEWNARPDNGRTLVVEPVVDELSFKSTTKRVFLGPLAGSSGVLMHFTIKDQSGRVLAQPQFFQRADAMAAGWVLGVHDNLMLTRVANLSTRYLVANYARAEGGPTGADVKGVEPN